MAVVLSRKTGGSGGGGAPSGPAGGDLSGTYPNPSIANGVVAEAMMDSGAAASGDVLTADGAGGASYETPTGGVVPGQVLGNPYTIAGTTTPVGSTNIFAIMAWLPVKATFTKWQLLLNSNTGNMDLGVYDSAGNAVRREGSFAVPAHGANDLTVRNLGGGSLTLDPGGYWLAVQFDNASVGIGLASAGAAFMFASSPSNTFPLPATKSFTLGSSTGPILALLP